ncbi:MAG: TolC family protein, partial [Thermoanaerobaculia bacterium]
MLTRPHSNPIRRIPASFCVALVVATAPLSATGPTTVSGQSLDLDACVRIAIAENPLLRAAQEGVAAAAESVGVARAAFYPEVGLDARYRRFDSHVFLPSGLPVQDTTLGATDDWSTGLRVGYSLFDSGVRRAERDAAIAAREASGHDFGRVRQDVLFAVHQAYYRVLATEAARGAAEARAARARDHQELAQTLKDAGSVPQADVLRARAESAGARLALVQAKGDVKSAYGDLNTAMGLPAALPIAALAPTPAKEDPAGHADEAALDRALSQRPELKAAQERITAAQHQAAAIEGIYGPRVRADLALGVRDSELLPEDRDWSVGVSLQLPIFSGFAKTHRVARASIEVRIREAEAEALVNRIRQEVWVASTSLATAEEALRQAEELRTEAEQSLGYTRARYEAGAGTINDLLDAESTLTQADTAQITAVLGHRLATSLLLR